MPVEIKELVIKAVTTSESTSSERPLAATLSPEEKEAIIEECVRQILHMLKRQEER